MITYLYKLNNLLDDLISRTLRIEFQTNLVDTRREYTHDSKFLLIGIPVMLGINLSITQVSDYDWILYLQLSYAFFFGIFIHFKPVSFPLWLMVLHLPLFTFGFVIAEFILYEKYLTHPILMMPLIFFICFYFHNLKFSLSLFTVAFGLIAYTLYLRDIDDAFILWNLYFGSTIILSLTVYRINVRILKASQTDTLTGLYNRGFAEKTLSIQFNLSKRLSTSLSLIYLDIDDFKTINDSYGHHQGDKILCEVADSLRLVSRKSDIVSRWGGDEFVIILPAIDLAHAQKFIERLLENIINVEISCGLVELQENENIGQFLTRADQSMYKIKNKKKQHSLIKKDRGIKKQSI